MASSKRRKRGRKVLVSVLIILAALISAGGGYGDLYNRGNQVIPGTGVYREIRNLKSERRG